MSRQAAAGMEGERTQVKGNTWQQDAGKPVGAVGPRASPGWGDYLAQDRPLPPFKPTPCQDSLGDQCPKTPKLQKFTGRQSRIERHVQELPHWPELWTQNLNEKNPG